MNLLRIALPGLTFVAFLSWQVTGADEKITTIRQADHSDIIDNCISCHKGGDSVDIFKEKYQSHRYFRTNESKTWKDHDPHSKGHEVLKSDVGIQMAKNLKALYNDPDYSPLTDVRCLTCHAVDTAPAAYAKKLDAAAIDQRFIHSDGVGIGCIACHDLNKSKDWIAAHQKVPSWRKLDSRQRSAMGLRELRDPLVKATLCYSCHIGNASEGKIVTHEMYAAGHPPLPPLELMSFVEQQPRHFWLPEEVEANAGKAADVPKPADPPRYAAYDDYRARHVAVGALAALRAEADLLDAEADDRIKNKAAPDYARFDCYACHHDLKLPSDRQNRGYDGPPGRPPLKMWNAALAMTVVKFAESHGDPGLKAAATGFGDVWKVLVAASHAQPYGKPEDVQKAAKALAGWCDEFLKSLAKAPAFKDPKDVERLTTMLRDAVLSDRYRADPEAVMALVWAFRALDTAKRDWSEIDKMLPTALRSSAQLAGPQPVTITTPAKPGEPSLGSDRLKRFNLYDSEKFKTLFPPKPAP